jgi:hypothetical protein
MQPLRIALRLVFGIVAFGGVETASVDVVYSFTYLRCPRRLTRFYLRQRDQQ